MTPRTMGGDLQDYDFSRAVEYHHGGFPPQDLELTRMIGPLARARDALARYDQMLTTLRNSALLLAPMRRQEAVVSSRIEGTITTVDALLQFEADEASHARAGAVARDDTLETYLYARAIREAERKLSDGWPLSNIFLCEMHGTLLSSGRGRNKNPGEFKNQQNYIADKIRKQIHFIPIEPLHLAAGMDALHTYIADENILDPLIRVAVTHAEFEALHPFDDGNGRIGRMLVTLMLWRGGLLSGPHFFLSAHLEREKDEYIERLRQVSAANDWSGWCAFFFDAIETAARDSLSTAQRIAECYDTLRDAFRDATGSRWHVNALDFMFERPVFNTTQFVDRMKADCEMSSGTARRFITELARPDRLILEQVRPGAGPLPALYALEPLIKILRV